MCTQRLMGRFSAHLTAQNRCYVCNVVLISVKVHLGQLVTFLDLYFHWCKRVATTVFFSTWFACFRFESRKPLTTARTKTSFFKKPCIALQCVIKLPDSINCCFITCSRSFFHLLFFLRWLLLCPMTDLVWVWECMLINLLIHGLLSCLRVLTLSMESLLEGNFSEHSSLMSHCRVNYIIINYFCV